MRYLLIAEKPSLMRAIRDCYNNHKAEVVSKVGEIEFIALSGHVCRNAEPNEYPEWKGLKWQEISYPMRPKKWKTVPINDEYKKKTLKELKEKLATCDAIICATDSDIEGYGIHFMISEYLDLHKVPTLRFIEHSLTDKEILHSLLTMTDLHTDPVHRNFTSSYLVRSRADWLYGFNLSRVMTIATGSKKAVGRVKAPTIKMVYDRCNEIDGFTKKTWFEIVANYGSFKAKLVDEKGKNLQYDGEPAVKEIIAGIPKNGKILSVQGKKNTSTCQKLYDLSALQTDAGKVYGYNPQQTLDIAQELYETHKVLSYPRTQCRYVSKERAKEFKDMLPAILAYPEMKQIEADMDIRRAMNKNVVNDAEVTKEAHDALLPTGVIPDFTKMSAAEKNIFFLVCRRLAEQFLPECIDQKTTAMIGHPDNAGYIFKAEGTECLQPGWRVLSKARSLTALPVMKAGDALTANSITPAECATRPPKRFTQASLAEAMENIAKLITDNKEARDSLAESKGIGQASTRAKIITEIIKFGYVEDKKDGLYITQSGREYVESLKGTGIEDPMFAAELDMQIKRVQRGEETLKDAYSAVLTNLDRIIKNVDMSGGAGQVTNVNCPTCGKKLVTGKWEYACSCGFKIRREFCGHTITESELTTLLSGGAIGPFKMYSQTKKKNFEAKLIFKDGKLAFPDESQRTEVDCPNCGKPLIAQKYSYICDCGFSTKRVFCGHTITEQELKTLFAGGEIGPFDMVSQAGKKFNSKLVFKDGKLGFPERGAGGPVGKEIGVKCPECGKVLMDGKWSYGCSCGFKAQKVICEHTITPKELNQLLGGEAVGPFNMKKKNGDSFSSKLRLENGKLSFTR